jgi:xanthine dehydrogenase accessory factor
VGGGALERQVLTEMLALLTAMDRGELAPASDGGGPRALSLGLGPALGMCCGGGVEVLLEPLEPARAVLIVGAGHVATALAPVLLGLGFAVSVCDEREEWAEPSRLPGARVVPGSFRDAGRSLARRAAVLVMTHDHGLDQEAVEWALREGFAFVGGIGSRAKAARTRARLEARGYGAADVARVRMPLGVAVGARTPQEIAVAIAAELIAWRRGSASATASAGASASANGSAGVNAASAEGAVPRVARVGARGREGSLP